MAGANLSYTNSPQAREQALSILGYKSRGPGRTKQIAVKNGAPVTNAAADDPDAVGDICLDRSVSPFGVYISTLRTNPTTHTWVKISP